MTPFAAYQTYLSLKLHFSQEGYDALKYNLKASAKEETFWARKDRVFFEAAARKFKTRAEWAETVVANLLSDVTYVRDMLGSEDLVFTFRARRERMQYQFECDFRAMLAKTHDIDCMIINDPDSSYPVVVQGLIGGWVGPESGVILNRVFGFTDRVKIDDPIIWPAVRLKILKYDPFVAAEKDKYLRIAQRLFTMAV